MKNVSIRFFIVSIFLLLCLGIISSMLYWQYHFSDNFTKKSAQKEFENLSISLQEAIKNNDTVFLNYLTLFSTLLKDEKLEEVFKNNFEYVRFFSIFLKNHKNLYSVHIGNGKNHFFQVVNLNTNKTVAQKLKHAQTDAWLSIEIDGDKKTKRLTYFDKDFHATFSQSVLNDYRVTSRPWYLKATYNKNTPIKTEPYEYVSIQEKGISYALNYSDGEVICINMLSNNYNDMLRQKHFSQEIGSFILDKNLNIIASTMHSALSATYKKTICDIDYLKKIKISQTQNIQSETHFYRLSKLGEEYLLSCVNMKEARKNFLKKFKAILFIVGGIIIVLFPLIWYLTSIIIKPIRLLSNENKKIENFNFDKVQKVDSKISEISKLSESFVSMAKSIEENKRTLEEKVEERTKELEKLSMTDKITNLANRVRIDTVIIEELERYERYKHQFGLIFIDIDFFKQVNDIYGHPVGDKVLQEFANVIKSNSRKVDIVGRWGGEEFIIICTEIDESSLIKIAQKLQKIICTTSFYKVGRKTASFGLTLCRDKDTLAEIMQRVDQALYLAKQNGRNRIELIL